MSDWARRDEWWNAKLEAEERKRIKREKQQKKREEQRRLELEAQAAEQRKLDEAMQDPLFELLQEEEKMKEEQSHKKRKKRKKGKKGPEVRGDEQPATSQRQPVV